MKEATSIRVLLAFSLGSYKIGNIDCVHAEVYSPCCTLLARSRVPSTRVILIESLVRRMLLTHGQLQDRSPG